MKSNRQDVRDLTDVYRRDKEFLQQRKNLISSNEKLSEREEEDPPKYYVKEYDYNFPCNCQTSSTRKLSQSRTLFRPFLKEFLMIDFIGGIKMSLEFFLFMGYVIGRRNELLECHYPFDPPQSYNTPTNQNYPFVCRTKYSNEMKKLNAIRHQLNQKPSFIKHTVVDTYYDIH